MPDIVTAAVLTKFSVVVSPDIFSSMVIRTLDELENASKVRMLYFLERVYFESEDLAVV